MEEKVKITLPSDNEEKKILFGGETITLKTKINLDIYSNILSDIMQSVWLNSKISDKSYATNLRLIKVVLDLCTNIDTSAMNVEDFTNSNIEELLDDNISNYWEIKKFINDEYETFRLYNCFGLLVKKVPSAKQLNNLLDKLPDVLNKIDTKNLENIAKSIVWNESPVLGKTLAPAEKINKQKKDIKKV